VSTHLRCEDVVVRFGGLIACNKVSLEVQQGKIVGLIGPNGAGKTTLFNVLSRFQRFDAGNLFFRDKSIGGFKPHQMAQLGMARTFQNINLFSDQTTLANILIGAHHLSGNPISNVLHLPGARAAERQLIDRAVEIADLLRLGNDLDRLVHQLPYGVRKRIEIARALASQPEIILLDEPVAGCNDEETKELKEVIRRVNHDLGITVLLVEHDMSMVMSVCDYIYVMNFGANLAEGAPQSVRTNRDVIHAYLGEEGV
jgi:branched-chain amino acid transport system ATP-binding protein